MDGVAQKTGVENNNEYLWGMCSNILHPLFRTPSFFLTNHRSLKNIGVMADNALGDANIEKNLRTYICFAASVVTPRAYKSESIKFQTLVQRRQSMVYWITRKCSKEVSEVFKRWEESIL